MNGWIIKRGTRELAVPDEATLKKWADERRYRTSDQIFHPVLQRWLPATEVDEIRHAFAETETATRTPPTSPSDSNTSGTAALGDGEANARGAMRPRWGALSRLLGSIGGSIAIYGGFTLLNLRAAGENSLIEAIAHGLGIYCIGKGMFMIAAVVNFQAAVNYLATRIRT